ncbi:phosphate propanoyltransferase [Proteocatella sphenisci]|uniref:phosphate propanoyltransferase n=1 Tax=Proteocatella sphenisci TaxID=181070 RepID=UPI00048E3C5D|nr:phosphate propanoyltransferase [Proteocatella sphenisci]
MNTQNLIDQITELVLAEIGKINDAQSLIPVGISARHVHLSQEDVEILFGKGHQLTFLKSLSQPGQFAAQETVNLTGPRGSIEKVRILGPVRSHLQMEISLSDARILGINPPIRESGDIENTPGLKISGPKGEIHAQKGAIIAERHAHMSDMQAAAFGIADGDYIRVFVEGKNGGVMQRVKVRAKNSYALDLHIDTDNANAFALKQGQMLRFEKIEK